MSTATLSGLRDYLYSTLTPSNMLWLSTELADYAKKLGQPLEPLTLEGIKSRIAESEKQIAAGLSQDSEDMFRELEEEFAREDQLELAKAI